VSNKSWKDVSIGGLIIEAGNSADYETGSWRTSRPIIDLSKCNNCMICWIYCPDSAIIVKDGELKGIDLDHCKGCGICAAECPKKAIIMVEESAAAEESAVEEGVH